jgi:hypothetical protein
MLLVINVDWIDENISAELPNVDDESSVGDIMYKKLVKDHMSHKCAPLHVPNGCVDKDTLLCKRGYSNLEPILVTTLDENGYPIYRRRHALRIIPHNRDVLLDWGGHANVEYAGSCYSVLYLFKYLHNGNKKVKVNLEAINEGISLSPVTMTSPKRAR